MASRAAIILVVTLLASTSTGLWAYRLAAADHIAATSDKFAAIMSARRDQLAEYLDSVVAETRFWNNNRIMRAALLEFTDAWHELGDDRQDALQRLYIHDNPYPAGQRDNLEAAGDGSEYSRVHARYHYWLRSFLLHRGVHDVFLFDPEGDLVYTSFKERDFATNLVRGAWKGSDLGRAFRIARDNPFPSYVAFFDFAPYEPSDGTPASFFSSPVLADDGAFLGVLAFQIPVARIDAIMQATAGMGTTGESYLVGEDLLMRSNSRFGDQSTVLETTVDTAAARKALRGETGLEITGSYRGLSVLSAYAPLEFESVTWAVLAEIDESELMAPLVQMRRRILLVAGAAGLIAGAVLIALVGRRSPSQGHRISLP
jgi:methyl-accepting chemotaxis protein